MPFDLDMPVRVGDEETSVRVLAIRGRIRARRDQVWEINGSQLLHSVKLFAELRDSQLGWELTGTAYHELLSMLQARSASTREA